MWMAARSFGTWNCEPNGCLGLAGFPLYEVALGVDELVGSLEGDAEKGADVS